MSVGALAADLDRGSTFGWGRGSGRKRGLPSGGGPVERQASHPGADGWFSLWRDGWPVGRRVPSGDWIPAGRSERRAGSEGLAVGGIPSGRSFAVGSSGPGRDGRLAVAAAFTGGCCRRWSGPCRGRPNRSSRVVLRDVSFRVVRLEPALGSAGSLGAVALRGCRIERAGRAPHRGNAGSLAPEVPRGFSARTVWPEPGRRMGELPGTTALRSCSERANRPEPVGIDRDPGDSSTLGQGRRLRGSERSLREGCGRSTKGEFSSRKACPALSGRLSRRRTVLALREAHPPRGKRDAQARKPTDTLTRVRGLTGSWGVRFARGHSHAPGALLI